jgi:hypothetical protein
MDYSCRHVLISLLEKKKRLGGGGRSPAANIKRDSFVINTAGRLSDSGQPPPSLSLSHMHDMPLSLI